LRRIPEQLFDQARTFSYWQARPVPEGLVEAAFPAGLTRPDERQLRAAERSSGAQPTGEGTIAILRLDGQLREGADGADHRDRLRPRLPRLAFDEVAHWE
jgi:hypothetical protein